VSNGEQLRMYGSNLLTRLGLKPGPETRGCPEKFGNLEPLITDTV